METIDKKQELREHLATASQIKSAKVIICVEDWELEDMKEVLANYNSDKNFKIKMDIPTDTRNYFQFSMFFDNVSVNVKSKEVEVEYSWKFKKTA